MDIVKRSFLCKKNPLVQMKIRLKKSINIKSIVAEE